MENNELATLGGGCFWCLEAAFNKVKGVSSALSGFAGGHIINPTYHQIISGQTGHAEVVQVTYDPNIISYELILDIFFQLHDPTQLNRQGNDVGTQYRSIILSHSDNQRHLAANKINNLDVLGIWEQNIVTEIKDFDAFYIADDYHQGYAENNPNQPYCALLISPKLDKFKAQFKDWLK